MHSDSHKRCCIKYKYSRSTYTIRKRSTDKAVAAVESRRGESEREQERDTEPFCEWQEAERNIEQSTLHSVQSSYQAEHSCKYTSPSRIIEARKTAVRSLSICDVLALVYSHIHSLPRPRALPADPTRARAAVSREQDMPIREPEAEAAVLTHSRAAAAASVSRSNPGLQHHCPRRRH